MTNQAGLLKTNGEPRTIMSVSITWNETVQNRMIHSAHFHIFYSKLIRSENIIILIELANISLKIPHFYIAKYLLDGILLHIKTLKLYIIAESQKYCPFV